MNLMIRLACLWDYWKLSNTYIGRANTEIRQHMIIIITWQQFGQLGISIFIGGFKRLKIVGLLPWKLSWNCWANPHLCLANHGFCSERSRTMMTLVWKVISFCDKGICRPATSELINIFGQSVFSWIPSFLDFSSPWENTMSWNYFL
jgi:hypothetical protein